MSIVDKLNKLIETKEAIRQSIIAKGVNVDPDTPFSQYAEKIRMIGADSTVIYGNMIVNVADLSVNENATATFVVKLDKAPTNNQTVALSVNNSNCTINKSTLTFTPSNYNTIQTVTVTGEHDENSFSDKSSVITLSSANVSNESINVTIKNIDENTTPTNGIELASQGFAINGNLDGKETFTHTETYISLEENSDKKIVWGDIEGWTMFIYYDENKNYVGYTQWPSATTEQSIGELITSAPDSAVYFRMSINKEVSQMNLVEADAIITYGNIVANSASLSVNEGSTVTFTVRLASAPTNNQVVNIACLNSYISVNKTSLTFTPSNYSTAQTVIVTGNHYSNLTSDMSSSITLSSTNVNNTTISVVVKNIDTPADGGEEDDNLTPVIALGNAPYISIGHVTTLIPQGTSQTVSVYVTDSTQKEYRQGDTSERFNIYYSIDGGSTNSIKNVSAGEHNIVLPSTLGIGEHEVEIYAVDSKNVISHKLYPTFKVKSTNAISTKSITDTELSSYGINKAGSTDATTMANTRTGLQRLMDDMHNQGYEKIVLPEGTYMVDVPNANANLSIPNNFTLDLNGSTIQQAPFTLDHSLLFEFSDVEDSHIINGTLKGDYETRDISAPSAGEHCGLVDMKNSSKYCSVENVMIRDSVGYTCCSTGSTIYGSVCALSNYTATNIDSNGQEVEVENMATSDYRDISTQLEFGWIMLGRYLGFRGIQGISFCVAHFYDSNKNYIKSEYTQMYRKIKIPTNARYVRATFKSAPSAITGTLCAFTPKIPYGGVYKDVEFYHTRTCAIAFTSMNNFLLDNVTFDNCATSITPAAIDLEDGWDQMQDFTIRNCKVSVQAGTIDLIVCGGYNFRMLNCENFRAGIRNRNVDTLISGNILSSLTIAGRIHRITDNTFKGTANADVFEDGQNPVEEVFKQIIVRDSIWEQATCYVGTGLGSVKYINCEFDYKNGTTAAGTFVLNNALMEGCVIKNYNSGNMHVMGNEFQNCTFENVSSVILRGTNKIIGGTLTNSNFSAWSADASTELIVQGGTWNESYVTPVNLGGGTQAFNFDSCTVNNTSHNLYNGQITPLSAITLNKCNINCGANDIIYFTGTPGSRAITITLTDNTLKTTGSVIDGLSSSVTSSNPLTVINRGNSGYSELVSSAINSSYVTINS